MISLPVRVRLTLWYFAMFASAAALLCTASLWMLQKSVEETEYHELQERADDVGVVLGHESPELSSQQLSHDMSVAYDLKDDGKYLQVRDAAGNWIFRSKRMIAENVDVSAPDRLPKDGLISQFHQGIHDVKALAYPVTVHGKLFSVQTGISRDKSIALLSRFRTNLLLLTPIVILIAAMGGHAMSSKALHPVAALAAEVQRINDRNLDVRLPVSRAKDEISDLSRTLNQMLERIDRAFASVLAFTGNASHELRTPITLLRTEIEIALLRPRKVEEYRATLGFLHKEILGMTSLLENLLSLARADAGAETIAFIPIRLSLLLRHVRESWQKAMNQSALNFRVEIPDDRVTVWADEISLLRLFSILLENARKFTPPGGSVTLSSTVEESSIHFSLHDTGSGIAPEHMPHIFERFYRAAPHSSGSGLGLALAMWIANRHGTDLSVESTPGHGSCFSFQLQRADYATPKMHPFRLALSQDLQSSPR